MKRVREWRIWKWWIWKAIVEGLAIGVAATVIGSLLLLKIEPEFVARYIPPDPTCDDPRDLVKVNVLERGDIKLEDTGTEPGWSAEAAFDGNPGTAWVPAKYDTAPTLTLTFEEPIDLQMICAVNGVASTEWAYLRADRIRTAEVQSLSDARPETDWYRAPLRTMSIDESQNRQQVRFQAGECSTLAFRIIERYLGVMVEDPELNGYVDPTGLVALGELELYVDQQGSGP